MMIDWEKKKKRAYIQEWVEPSEVQISSESWVSEIFTADSRAGSRKITSVVYLTALIIV